MLAMNFAYDARGLPMSLSLDGKKLAYIALDGKTVLIKDVSAMEAAWNENIAPEEKTGSQSDNPMRAVTAPPVAQQPAPAVPAAKDKKKQ